jgi:hypothetical protein
MIEIVSGGQTGVDRAALDAAIKLNIPHGGWCPKGRLAEDSTIAKHYKLKETYTSEYSERTKLNIRDSDGTLILTPETLDKITDGTILTIREVKEKNKPCLIISLTQIQDFNFKDILSWIKENHIKILNIAGPRESQSPGIYNMAYKFIESLLILLSVKNTKLHKKMPSAKL